MSWFVPVQGDPLLLAIPTDRLRALQRPTARRDLLVMRVIRACRAAGRPEETARRVGQHLAAAGVLGERPGGLVQLQSLLYEDPLLRRALHGLGLDGSYRAAPPDLVPALECCRALAWAIRLQSARLGAAWAGPHPLEDSAPPRFQPHWLGRQPRAVLAPSALTVGR